MNNHRGEITRPLRVLIRANGGSTIGMGHIVRSCSLIALLPPAAEVWVAVNPEVSAFAEELTPAPTTVYSVQRWLATPEEEHRELNHLIPELDLLVLDGYKFDQSYQEVFRHWARAMCCIDDIHHYPFVADLVINHAPSLSRSSYELATGTVLRTGPRYALLRSAFRAPFAASQVSNPDNGLFLCIGGADVNGLTADILQDLDALGFTGQIEVVLGGAVRNQDVLTKLTPGHSLNIRVHHQLGAEEMARVMRSCERAIVPASTVAFECIACGLYVALGYYVDNQVGVFHGFTDQQLVYPLGDLNSSAHRRQQLQEYLRQPLSAMPDALALSGMQDSGKRLQKELQALVTPLAARPAQASDAQQLYTWLNDPVTIRNSISRSVPKFEDHLLWLQSVLASEDRLLMIVETHDNDPVAQVRLDCTPQETSAVVSISVGPDWRGQGLSPYVYQKSLRYAQSWLRSKSVETIIAYIRAENVASRKSHEAIGFRYEDEVDGLQRYLLPLFQG